MTTSSNSPSVKDEPSAQSKLRLAILMIPAVYPLITALLYIVTPITEGWQIWQRTLVLTPVMVFLIAYVVTPFLRTRFGWCINIAKTPKDS